MRKVPFLLILFFYGYSYSQNDYHPSEISFKYISFAYRSGWQNEPITPGKEAYIRFYLHAYPKPIHMYYYKIAFVFADTTKDRIDSLKDAMKNTSDMVPLNDIIYTYESFSKKELLLKSPTSDDSIRFKQGNCLFALRIEYRDDITHNWNEFLIISTLKDKLSPESFTDKSIVEPVNFEDKGFKEPKNNQ